MPCRLMDSCDLPRWLTAVLVLTPFRSPIGVGYAPARSGQLPSPYHNQRAGLLTRLAARQGTIRRGNRVSFRQHFRRGNAESRLDRRAG